MKKLCITVILSLLIVTGCAKKVSNNTALPNYVSSIQEPKIIPKEKHWVKLVDGSDLMYDANHTGGHLEFNEEYYNDKANYFNKDRWDSFLKKYIESLPVNKRDAPLRILTHSFVQNDALENQMIFTTWIGGYENERSKLEISGVIKGKKIFPQIKFVFDNGEELLGRYSRLSPSMQLNRIKIYLDNDQLEPYCVLKRNGDRESAMMTLMDKGSMSLVKSIATANNSVIRFYGRAYYDFKLTDTDKKQLKLVIQALENMNSQ
jgi:hypothetical protein